MLRLTYYISSALILGIALAGCGNKGPLYLPPAPIEQLVSEESEQPASNVTITGDKGVEQNSEESVEESVLAPAQESENTEDEANEAENLVPESVKSETPPTPEAGQ